MKRFLVIALGMSLVMGNVVFAAESDFSNIRFIWVKREEAPPVEKLRPYLSWHYLGEEFFAQKVGAARIFLDGKEKELNYPLYRKQGQIMIAAEDLANVIDGSIQPSFGERSFVLQADALRNQNNAVWVGWQSSKTIQKDEAYGGDENAKAKMDSEGIYYIPLREMAESVLYDVAWKKMGNTEYFMLKSHQMPQLAASARYDAEKNIVFMSLNNWTQETYLYGEEFFIQKWDGSQWQRVSKNREICYAYPADQELPGVPEGDWIAASRTMEHSLVIYGDGDGLAPGKYQIYKEILQKNGTEHIGYHIGAEFLVE